MIKWLFRFLFGAPKTPPSKPTKPPEKPSRKDKVFVTIGDKGRWIDKEEADDMIKEHTKQKVWGA